jgi:hypothetical protein
VQQVWLAVGVEGLWKVWPCEWLLSADGHGRFRMYQNAFSEAWKNKEQKYFIQRPSLSGMTMTVTVPVPFQVPLIYIYICICIYICIYTYIYIYTYTYTSTYILSFRIRRVRSVFPTCVFCVSGWSL